MDEDEHYAYLKQIADEVKKIILNDVGKACFYGQIENFKTTDELRITGRIRFARTQPTDEQILRDDYIRLTIIHDFIFDKPGDNRICFNPKATQHWYNRWALKKWDDIVNSPNKTLIRALIEQRLARVKEDIIEHQKQDITNIQSQIPISKRISANSSESKEQKELQRISEKKPFYKLKIFWVVVVGTLSIITYLLNISDSGTFRSIVSHLKQQFSHIQTTSDPNAKTDSNAIINPSNQSKVINRK